MLKNLGLCGATLIWLATLAFFSPSALAHQDNSTGQPAGSLLLEPFYLMPVGENSGVERILVSIEHPPSQLLKNMQSSPAQLRAVIYEVLKSGKAEAEWQRRLTETLTDNFGEEPGFAVKLSRSRLLLR